MKNVFISLFAGASAAVAMIMVLANYHPAQYQNQSGSTAIELQHPFVHKESKQIDFQKALDSAVAKVMDEVNALKSDFEGVRSQQATLSRALDKLAQNGVSFVANEQVAKSTQESIRDDWSQEEELFDSPDDTMNAQQADPTWDDVAATRITNSIFDAGFERSHLQDVVCRGTMCRVEIFHDDEDATTELFEGEQPLVPWNYKGVIETAENEWGDFVTVMYITREGYEFPDGS